MLNKQELLEHCCQSLKVTSDKLMWSEKCINPTEGFIHNKELNTQQPNALGYWVLK